MELLNEYDKAQVQEKQTRSTGVTLEQIDLVLQQLQEARAALIGLDDSTEDELVVVAKEKVSRLAEGLGHAQAKAMAATKDLHGAVAKYAKALDKDKKLKSAADIDDMWNPRVLDHPDARRTLHTAVIQHLVREGRFGLARTFAAEGAKADRDRDRERDWSADSDSGSGIEGQQGQFAEMYAVLAGLRAFDVAPAEAWVARNAVALAAVDSPLAFAVARLAFLKLLFGSPSTPNNNGNSDNHNSNNNNNNAPNRAAALAYAQTAFAPFKIAHLKDIQKLMCCFAYSNNIAQSPYKALYSHDAWSDLAHIFTRDFCLLLHLPPESPLQTCVSVGVNALPTIIKMSSILKDQSGLEWSTHGELPVEIPLLDRQRFHSIFACPVSKELGTKENPPMMMVCGHVVCKESLLRLGKG
ncbi:hypothetical protein HK100_011489, partial [Physocladia obscura]